MDTYNEIISLVNDGQKLHAIKLLREAHPNFGLKNAKEIVDLIASGNINEHEVQEAIDAIVSQDLDQYDTQGKEQLHSANNLIIKERKSYSFLLILLVAVAIALYVIFIA